MRARKEERSPNPLRILAPLALVACAIALLAILLSGGGAGLERAGPKKTKVPAGRPRLPDPLRRPGKGGEAGGVYTVKSGDTPGAIAQKTKISLEKLQELNPELDPQGLVLGQKLKLRR